MSKNFIETRGLTLKTSIGTTDTQLIISGAYGLDGSEFTLDDFGDGIYATIDPNTSSAESVLLTFVSSTSGDLTANVTRALKGKQPYGTGGIAYSHSAGAKIVFTNSSALFNEMSVRDREETISGAKTYTGNNVHQGTESFTGTLDATAATVTVKTPTSDTEAARKDYVDTGLATKADDSAVVHLTGAESVAGVKTFSDAPIIPTATGSTEAVNKGQMETYIAASSGDVKASDTVYGTTKLDVAPDSAADPIAIGVNSPLTSATRAGDSTDNGKAIYLEQVDTEEGKIAREFIPAGEKVNMPTLEDKTYVDTPILCSANLGDIVTAISSSQYRRTNLCFVSESVVTTVKPSFLNKQIQTTSVTTSSVTANAGTNRLLVVFAFEDTHYGGAATWGGASMTNVLNVAGTDTKYIYMSVYYKAIGDSGSNETQDLVFANAMTYIAFTIDNIDQSSPYNAQSSEAHGNDLAASRANSDVDLAQAYGIRLFGGGVCSAGTVVNSGATEIYSSQTVTGTWENLVIGAAYDLGTAEDTGVSITADPTDVSSYNSSVAYVAAFNRADIEDTVPAITSGVVGGFTGLTVGAKYFVSSTAGEITTIDTGYPVGVAISATELLMF